MLDNSSLLAVCQKKREAYAKINTNPRFHLISLSTGCVRESRHTVRGVASSVLHTLRSRGGSGRIVAIYEQAVSILPARYESYVPILLRRVRCTSVRACCDNLLLHPPLTSGASAYAHAHTLMAADGEFVPRFPPAIPCRKLMVALSKIESLRPQSRRYVRFIFQAAG